MKIGSLCSGYEGLGMAVQALIPEAELAWVSDIDKGANKILAHRYPDVPNLGDFTKVDWSAVTPIEILIAGYPCQPFSGAGKRLGVADPRHLWPEVLRCLTELRPPFALFENVRGHLSLGFDQVLADLATHDYDARWIVLRAADIGAPHGRARLFILASDARRGGDRWDLVGAGRGAVRVGGVCGEDPAAGGDEGRAGVLGGMTLLPTPTTSDTNGAGAHGDGGTDLRTTVSLLPTPRATRGGSATETTQLLPTPRASDGEKGGPNQRGSSGDYMLPGAVFHLLPTPAVNDMGAAYTPEEWDAWTDRMKAEHGNGNGHGKSLSIEAQRLLPTPTVQDVVGSRNSTAWRSDPDKPVNIGDTLTDFAWKHDGHHDPRMPANEPMQGWGDYAPAIHRWEQILGRPAPAPTMTSTKGNPQLSPRFVEWMMGLPEGWVDDVPNLTRNEKLKALGNGVVSQQAVEAVLRMLALGSEAAA